MTRYHPPTDGRIESSVSDVGSRRPAGARFRHRGRRDPRRSLDRERGSEPRSWPRVRVDRSRPGRPRRRCAVVSLSEATEDGTRSRVPIISTLGAASLAGLLRNVLPPHMGGTLVAFLTCVISGISVAGTSLMIIREQRSKTTVEDRFSGPQPPREPGHLCPTEPTFLRSRRSRDRQARRPSSFAPKEL